MNKIDIRSMSFDELSAVVSKLGQPSFRTGQIFSWLQSGVTHLDEMTNIPAVLRAKLAEGYYIVTANIKKCWFVNDVLQN